MTNPRVSAIVRPVLAHEPIVKAFSAGLGLVGSAMALIACSSSSGTEGGGPSDFGYMPPGDGTMPGTMSPGSVPPGSAPDPTPPGMEPPGVGGEQPGGDLPLAMPGTTPGTPPGMTPTPPTPTLPTPTPPPVLPNGPISAECVALATDPGINWREGALQTDQEIVECLMRTLGRPVGYGESALGGYDPAGNSELVVISTSDARSVEQQVLDAVSGEAHRWIVFDKDDFADPFEIGMYRLACADPAILAAIGGTEAECRDYRQWCNARGIADEAACLEEFFNVRLNDSELPLRNPVIGSNKTLDGRVSEAFFRFSGFAIGRDSSGTPTQTANSVILTHLSFQGAGHTEDHGLDPDMIRSTGASRDIWIHKNDFDLTGDSAFDVKVGAFGVTMSFNRVADVLRATLHGSSDDHTINVQTTTTLHHNAFVTRDAQYLTFGNTARRVPLLRAGTSHMFDNVFVNYRKDVLSIRVGGSLLWQDNLFVVNQAHQEKDSVEDSLDELSANMARDVGGGSYRGEGISLFFSDAACNLSAATQRGIVASSGTVADLATGYSPASRAAIAAQRIPAGQELVDYVSATAGKRGQEPFNSPLAQSRQQVLALGKVPCQ
jgi:pectate lyase